MTLQVDEQSVTIQTQMVHYMLSDYNAHNIDTSSHIGAPNMKRHFKQAGSCLEQQPLFYSNMQD